MRTLRKNKQKMYYSLYVNSSIVYERDDEGNLIVDYVDADGNEYYRESGTTEPHYDTPVEFWASISSKLNELHAREYGVDQSSVYSEICCGKGQLNLTYGAKIWKKSEIGYKPDGTVDESTSDYTVKGILDEFLDFDWYLLQRNNK